MKTWTIQLTIKVADSWIADGFDANDRLDEISEQVSRILPFAYGHELKVKAMVKTSPNKATIRALQNGDKEPKD